MEISHGKRLTQAVPQQACDLTGHVCGCSGYPGPSGSRVLGSLHKLDHKRDPRRRQEQPRHRSDQPCSREPGRPTLASEQRRKAASQHQATPDTERGASTALCLLQDPPLTRGDTEGPSSGTTGMTLQKHQSHEKRRLRNRFQIKGGSGGLQGGPQKTCPPRSRGWKKRFCSCN